MRPKIFDGLPFYVQSVGVSVAKRSELVDKLTAQGGIEIPQPDAHDCKAIFVFAQEPIKRFKSHEKARPIETCQHGNYWTFFDLCAHFGRVEGNKVKYKQFVVDYTWVDDCITKGINDQRGRWGMKEIMVKKRKILPAISVQTTPDISNAPSPLTPASMSMTPVDTTVTRLPSLTPAVKPEPQPGQAKDLFKVSTDPHPVASNTTTKVAPTNTQTPATASTSADPLELSASLTLQEVGPCVDTGLRNTVIRSEDQNAYIPPADQSQPFTKGRKRAATLSTLVDTGAKSKKRATLQPAPRSSVANSSISQDVQKQADDREKREQFRMDVIIRELDEWCQEGSPGSRTALFARTSVKSEVTPVLSPSSITLKNQIRFDRSKFFLSHRNSIMEALAKKGHDVSDGTKVFGNHQYGPRKFVFKKGDGSDAVKNKTSNKSSYNVSEAVRTIESQSNGTRAVVMSSISEATDVDTVPPPLLSIGRDIGETGATATTPKDPHNSRLTTSKTANRHRPNEGKRKNSRLKKIVHELDRWCKAGSPGSRTAYFIEVYEAKRDFHRESFFKRNRESILGALSDLGHDVSEGSKLFKTNAGGWYDTPAGPARNKSKGRSRASSSVNKTSPRAKSTPPETQSPLNYLVEVAPKPTNVSTRPTTLELRPESVVPVANVAQTLDEPALSSHEITGRFPLGWLFGPRNLTD